MPEAAKVSQCRLEHLTNGWSTFVMQHIWTQVEETPGAEAQLWSTRRRLAQSHPQV